MEAAAAVLAASGASPSVSQLVPSGDATVLVGLRLGATPHPKLAPASSCDPDESQGLFLRDRPDRSEATISAYAPGLALPPAARLPQQEPAALASPGGASPTEVLSPSPGRRGSSTPLRRSDARHSNEPLCGSLQDVGASGGSKAAPPRPPTPASDAGAAAVAALLGVARGGRAALASLPEAALAALSGPEALRLVLDLCAAQGDSGPGAESWLLDGHPRERLASPSAEGGRGPAPPPHVPRGGAFSNLPLKRRAEGSSSPAPLPRPSPGASAFAHAPCSAPFSPPAALGAPASRPSLCSELSSQDALILGLRAGASAALPCLQTLPGAAPPAVPAHGAFPTPSLTITTGMVERVGSAPGPMPHLVPLPHPVPPSAFAVARAGSLFQGAACGWEEAQGAHSQGAASAARGPGLSRPLEAPVRAATEASFLQARPRPAPRSPPLAPRASAADREEEEDAAALLLGFRDPGAASRAQSLPQPSKRWREAEPLPLEGGARARPCMDRARTLDAGKAREWKGPVGVLVRAASCTAPEVLRPVAPAPLLLGPGIALPARARRRRSGPVLLVERREDGGWAVVGDAPGGMLAPWGGVVSPAPPSGRPAWVAAPGAPARAWAAPGGASPERPRAPAQRPRSAPSAEAARGAPAPARSQAGLLEDVEAVAAGELRRVHLEATLAQPIEKVERQITNGTYINRLHVTQQMAQLLFPQADEQARRDDPAGMNFSSLFKHRLTVVDEADKAWPVQYEGFMSSGQRHYRLTSGWSTLMRTQRVGIGDTLVLERWTRDRFVIHLRIVARPRPQPLPPPSRASSGRLEASRGEGV